MRRNDEVYIKPLKLNGEVIRDYDEELEYVTVRYFVDSEPVTDDFSIDELELLRDWYAEIERENPVHPFQEREDIFGYE